MNSNDRKMLRSVKGVLLLDFEDVELVVNTWGMWLLLRRGQEYLPVLMSMGVRPCPVSSLHGEWEPDTPVVWSPTSGHLLRRLGYREVMDEDYEVRSEYEDYLKEVKEYLNR